MFGRSEISPGLYNPNLDQQPYQPQRIRPKTTVNRQSYFGEVSARNGNGVHGLPEEEARATPPPIQRSRGVPSGGYRPSSAGGVAHPRKDSGHLPEALDDRVAQVQSQSHARRVSGNVIAGVEEGDGARNGNGRKWFGIRRSGSFKRN